MEEEEEEGEKIQIIIYVSSLCLLLRGSRRVVQSSVFTFINADNPDVGIYGREWIFLVA